MSSLLICLLATAPCAATAAADDPKRKRQDMALIVTGGPTEDRRQGLEDLLHVTFGCHPRIRLVDRSVLAKVLAEHALSLRNSVDERKALAVGRIAGADVLLFVEFLPKAAAVRLVEPAGGKVLLEDKVALRDDPHLTVAAVREAVLKALDVEPPVAGRLTVGVTAFPNRSGTDRSDKLGLALARSLRKRLRTTEWATVLERQYPTALLDEIELTRLGLAKGPPEALPPADLAIMGSTEDLSRTYRAGEPWAVKLDLVVRLHKRSTRFSQVCRSDAIDTAAEAIVKRIEAFRKAATTSRPARSEKAFWRAQATYLMPRSPYQVGRPPHDCFKGRQKLDTIEAIRAWENLLLLDADDTEAALNLGVCLVSLYRPWPRRTGVADAALAARQWLRGARLVERACRAEPSPHNATTFYFVANAAPTPQRKRMLEYIISHPKVFSASEVKHSRIALASLAPDGLFAEIERAAAGAREDPGPLCYLTIQLNNRPAIPPDKVIAFAANYLDSEVPVVRFLFEYATAETLWRRKKDPAALAHFDRAIRVHEQARAALRRSGNRLLPDDIYRFKIVACEALGKPDEARATALAGARHFMSTGRFNCPISWLYYHCVSDVLTAGQEKEALAICDAYLEAAARHKGVQNQYGSQILLRRLRLVATLSGNPIPGFDSMTLIKGTETSRLRAPRMTIAGGRLWLAWQRWQSGGPAMVYVPGSASAQRLETVPGPARAVAAVGKKVFFGGRWGLVQLDTDGAVRKRYSTDGGQLPADHVVDLCRGGDRIYMCFRQSDRYGVGVLDPATGTVTVLAPTSRKATLATEPVYGVYRVWWDAVNSRACANNFFLYESQRGYSRRGWIQTEGGWRRLKYGEPIPSFILSQDDEALRVTRLGEKTEFAFVGTGRKIQVDLPLPELVGEPAWDAARIWVPCYTGLYEIDRKTGQAAWIAHQAQTQCLLVLKHGSTLYVATTRGLFSREVPK